MRKAFSLYTYIPIHEKLFSVYTRIKKDSFPLYQHGLYKTSIPFSKISFSFFNIHSLFIQKFSLYTIIAYTQEFLFTHYLYTQNLFIHFLYTKILFFSLYTDVTFVHNASFFSYSWCYHDVCSFYFRTTFLNENSTRFRNFNKHYRQQRSKH